MPKACQLVLRPETVTGFFAIVAKREGVKRRVTTLCHAMTIFCCGNDYSTREVFCSLVTLIIFRKREKRVSRRFKLFFRIFVNDIIIMAKTTSCNLILFIVYFLLRFFAHHHFCDNKLTKFSAENTLPKVIKLPKIVVFHFNGKLGTQICIEIHATSISCFVDKKVEKVS